MRKYFGTDGVRGVANEELTAELAFKIGKAASYVLKENSHSVREVLIARDTRISGEMLESALSAAMLSMGLNVVECGVMPTPVLAWLTHSHKTVGFMVSASHNPWEHNGIKIFSNGFKLPDELEEEIEKHLESDLKSTEVGKKIHVDLSDEYVQWISRRYQHLKGVKIAFDLANGAAVSTVPRVVDLLEIKATFFNADPDGKNINKGCGSLHPEFLSVRMNEIDANFGVIHDGDADRCIMVSKNGKVIDGDDMLVINGKAMKAKGSLSASTVVGTVMTNLGVEEELKKNSITFVRTRVGDRYVLEEMKKLNANLGGEQSGHIIFFDLATTGDGLLTALETVSVAVKEGKDLEKLVEGIIRYPQKLLNVEVNDKNKVMRDERLKTFAEKINLKENLRVVLRPSGTEPLIRIMVEGKDESIVDNVLEEAYELVKEVSVSGKIS